jgi:hypothetical protein
MNPFHDLEILQRMLNLGQNDLTPAFAREVLNWQPNPKDRRRLHQLNLKNNRGELTAEEKAELESYIRVVRFLDLLRSKARLSLEEKAVLR